MDPSDVSRFTDVNRRAWDAIGVVRGAGLHPGEKFAQGVGNLAVEELPITDWQGLTVLHLQCASGEDTLSLALAGAEVTGVDIAESNIEHARRKAEIAGLDATFVRSDVYALPEHLLTGRFDVVFVSCGAVCWLPDLERWAAIVAAALKPGGRFLLDEIHPLSSCFRSEDGRLVAFEDYFRRDRPQWNAAGPPGLAGTGEHDVMPQTVEFRWPIGDIVTAIARAGLRIDRLDEYSESGSRIPEGFVLLATKQSRAIRTS